MARGRDPDEVASDAWRWFSTAETTWRKTPDGSADEIQAIQAMSLAALTAMVAEHLAEKR